MTKVLTKERQKAYFATEWELVSVEEWDKLSEFQRGIVSYCGEWRLAKRVGEVFNKNLPY